PRAEGPRRLTWKEKQELEGMEAAILEAEAHREALGGRLADPALYASAPGEVQRLSAEFHAAAARVEALYARWAELEEAAGAK
ncbi:MAG TPA: ABC transporter C-terminal domain-containing protein, partial [Longimicrobiaceae bacterium]|nr:ABC transporter C-terminal domain-containing protein [Longimicrobiaceae bacterium]